MASSPVCASCNRRFCLCSRIVRREGGFAVENVEMQRSDLTHHYFEHSDGTYRVTESWIETPVIVIDDECAIPNAPETPNAEEDSDNSDYDTWVRNWHEQYDGDDRGEWPGEHEWTDVASNEWNDDFDNSEDSDEIMLRRFEEHLQRTEAPYTVS